ncbi:MAG TPA: ChbG/HpnK family deacetylase, partial [Chloroflexota bacterium]|nr:ChbG/HpnK family deacetylase [Chloroflexota bacterium]
MGNLQMIVNADDLGLTPGVSAGILELARAGSVTSTSLLVNMPGSEEALEQALEIGLDVGMHLNLCAGRPLTDPAAIPTLVDAQGNFASQGEILRRRTLGRLNLHEVEREWTAQIEWMLRRGAMPSHVDSHCHLHSVHGLYPLALRLARRHGIRGLRSAFAGYHLQVGSRLRFRMRRDARTADGVFRTDHFSVLTNLRPVASMVPIAALLRSLPPGVHEFVCHPGHVDDHLRAIDPLTVQRELELQLLAGPHFRDSLARLGIALTSWREAGRAGA